jgi:hypothetical protein
VVGQAEKEAEAIDQAVAVYVARGKYNYYVIYFLLN